MRPGLIIIFIHLFSISAVADDDSDLIPTLLPKQMPAAVQKEKGSDSMSQKTSLEDSFSNWSLRNNLLVPIPTAQPLNQNRLSIDEGLQYQITNSTSFHFSDRFSSYSGDLIAWNQNGFARNDFREGFISSEVEPRTFFEVGRVNLKFGSALGYSPTDFFRSRSQVDLSSIDPSNQKENRLGVGMISWQKIFENGSMQFVYSPRFQNGNPLLTSPVTTFDPLFGQTNPSDRFLGALTYDLAGFNIQSVLFKDDVGTHVGLNLSRLASNSIVVYADWAGVNEQSLSQRAVSFGQSVGALPQNAPVLPQTDLSTSWRNDMAFGFSWSDESKLSANFEYHYHQSGFNNADLNTWITTGQSQSVLASELWYVRQYAADQQEPLMQQELFLRFEQQDFLFRYLNAGLISFINPYEGSALTQAYAQYFATNHWTFSALTTLATGSLSTEKGSLPWFESSVLQVKRYF